MTKLPPTVFVVDDDPAVRKGIVRLLKSAGYRAQPFASADEFLASWLPDPAPGCLLLDLMLPGIDGLQLQRRLQTARHGIPIIFISGQGDIPSSVSAMKAGAVDFLPKPFQDDELLRAVDEAVRRDARKRTEQADREAVAARFATLTPREREVMALVVRGLPNKRIAQELGVSEKTVKIHRGRVMEKMQAQSVAELVLAAQKIPPDRLT
jgi:RNA polymerase sigma factor (sigma-70 family)